MGNLRINKPEAGEKRSVMLEGGQSAAFAFSASAASVDRVGNDLIFRFDDGAEIRIQDFFATGGKELPAFVLEDGTQIAGVDLLRQLDSDMDIEAAAGPSAGSNRSGGSGEYAADAGNLIGGFDRLGIQGTTQWSRESEAPEFAPAVTAAALDTVAAPETPSAPDTPSVPDTPSAPDLVAYAARAVLYASTDNEYEQPSFTFCFRLMNFGVEPPRPYTAEELAPELVDAMLAGYQAEYAAISPVVNENGTLTGTLTQAGLDALAANGGENLYDYITLTVDGITYTMQLVVNQTGAYDSAAEDGKNPPGGDVPIWGEWHSETDYTGMGERVTGAGNDEFWFRHAGSAALTGTLHTGAGADTVSIACGVNEPAVRFSDLNTGLDADNDTVTIVSKGAGVLMSDITAVGGDNSITVEAVNNALDMSSTIHTGDGNDTITLRSSGKSGMEFSQITDEGGGNTIEIRSDANAAAGMKWSSITMNGVAADDKDTITVTSTGKSSAYAMEQAAITDMGGDGDSIIVNGVMANSFIDDMGKGGGDRVTVNGGMSGMQGGRIADDGGDGNTITVTGSGTAIVSGGIETGDGKGDIIFVKGGSTGASYSTITDKGGDGNTITVTGGQKYGLEGSRIETGGGKDEISATGGQYGLYGNSGIKDTGGNDNAITVEGGMSGLMQSTIHTGGGADHITVTGGRTDGLARSGITDAGGDGNTITVKGGNAGLNSFSTITTGDGKDEITVTGGQYGLFLNSGITDAGGDGDEITVTGGLHGMQASATITDKGGDGDAIIVKGVSGDGMTAGSHIVDASGDGDTIIVRGGQNGLSGKSSVTDAGGDNDTIIVTGGMYGIDDGTITDAGGGNDTVIVSGGQHGITARVSNASSTITATGGAVTVAATGSGDSKGVNADKAGKTAVSGETVSIYAGYAESPESGEWKENSSVKTSAGIFAKAGGTNAVNGGSLVDVKASGNEAWAISADGGTNKISAEETRLEACSKTGKAYGMSANAYNGTNTVQSREGGDLDMTIVSKAGGVSQAFAMYSDNGGANAISAAGTARVELNTGGNGNSGSAMRADNGGKNTIGAEIAADVDILGAGYGMWTSAGGKNAISAGALADVNIDARYYGIYADGAKGNAENTIAAATGTAKVDIKADREGIRADDGGKNAISAEKLVDVDIRTGGGGMTAGGYKGRGENTISSRGEADVDILAGTGGMEATKGKNTISAETFADVRIEADGRGMYAAASDFGDKNSSGNSISSQGNLHVEIVCKNGDGMYASYNSSNVIAGNSAEGTSGAGSDSVFVQGAAHSMYASGGYTQNHIATGGGADTVSLTGDMEAKHGGLNLVETGRGGDSVYVEGDMIANKTVITNLGRNVIASGEGDDTVWIDGGMFGVANGDRNPNVLNDAEIGNLIDTGAGNDTVWLQGGMNMPSGFHDGNDYRDGYGDFSKGNPTAVTNAANAIRTGAGDDTVRIDGDLSSSSHYQQNLVDTGDGDDAIRLGGKVGAGGLTLRAGEGYDTLILQADSASEFNSNYKEWLCGLTSEQFKAMGVESIKVAGTGGINAEEMGWLQEIADDHNVVFGMVNAGGEQYSLDGFLGGADSLDTLAGLMGHVGEDAHRLVLDLFGDKEDTLDLDELLGQIYKDGANGLDINEIVIKAGSNDSINCDVTGGTLTESAELNNGYTEYVYRPSGSSAEEDAIMLYIQTSV